MLIRIARRLKPFTHIPGTKIPIPYSPFVLHPFPTHLNILKNGALFSEHSLPLSGPVKGFTAELDLERGHIRLFGTAREGYYEALVKGDDQGVAFQVKKGPLALKSFGKAAAGHRRYERLSLGSHKSQEWSGIERRGDPIEYFPIWMALGQTVPVALQDNRGGTLDMLAGARDLTTFKHIWLAGFEGIMAPRLMDTDHHGFSLTPPDSTLSPLPLLTEGAKIIRQLFIEEKGEEILVLPRLPQEFHAGRLVDVTLLSGLQMNLEWSKKKIRRLELFPRHDMAVPLKFSKGESSFRVRTSLKDKGTRHPIEKTLQCEKGTWYSLDNFKH